MGRASYEKSPSGSSSTACTGRWKWQPNDTLLEVLRERLGIKSPKTGCDRGDCGTCTVFLDGRTVRSCLVLAAEADGCEIVTLEGISQNPTPLQHEFAKHNSFQCGFCAPGVVLSATELLREEPAAHARGDSGSHRRQPLPLHRLHAHHRRHRSRRMA